MPAGGLKIRPSLTEVCTAVLGHANAGDSLSQCFSAAASYPYRFDEAYSGVKDRLSNFGNYGDPIGNVNPTTLSWAYNDTSTKIFTVTTNKSRWYFSSECSGDDFFTWSVWDSSNTTQILSGIYTSGMVVRVTPNSNNTGGTNRTVILVIATYPDTIMTGCTMIGTQLYNGAGSNPIVNISCADGTFTVDSLDSVLNTGDTNLWFQFAPHDLIPDDRTIYVNVVRGGVTRGAGSITHCFNGVTKTKNITLSEGAISGATYYVNLYTSVP